MKLIRVLMITLTALVIMPSALSISAMQGKHAKQTPQPLTPVVSLSALAAPLNNLIAVDYQETSDSIIASLNYVNGQPFNFVRVSRTGVVTQFSNAHGFPEEVYLAVAPSQNCSGTGLSLGGFNVGDVFAGSGTGTVARISADGTVVQNPFATLPGETGQEWGGFCFDRTGNFGGDLIISTTSGGVYRVNSSGVATLVARLSGNGAIEGVIAMPNDSRFGPLSGKILVGGTDIGIPMTGATNILAVDPIDGTHPMGTFTTYSVPGVVEPEGFRIVPPNGDFFGTDFLTQSLVSAPSSGFSFIVGDLVVAAEGLIDPSTKTSKLFDVVWDPVNNKLKTTELIGGSVFQYEGITFSCTAAPCVPSTLSCPGVCMSATGPSAVTFTTPVTTGGTNPGQAATCVPPSGSVFAPGTTPVNCTAPDGCTGTATCSFNVVVASSVLSFTDFTGSGSSFTLDTSTGVYTFRCGDGTTMTGTGHITIRGGVISLNDICVQVDIDCASGRAIGTLKMPMDTVKCFIQARNVVCGFCH